MTVIERPESAPPRASPLTLLIASIGSVVRGSSSGRDGATIDTAIAEQQEPGRPSARLRFLLPVLGFAALAAALAWGLRTDPRALPSTLIGKPAPQFALPPVKGRSLGFSTADLTGDVSLVNVFASWCVACRQEHPLFMALKADGVVPIHGINYKDRPDDAARWLDTLGDPYTRTGADRDGRVAIDWGVFGVPETFVVTKDGRVAYRHIGPLTDRDMDNTILPLVRRLRGR
jgi:cytochrome c biogenesis protein CcmG/thiol:disulfide interchange protein DsbE